MCELLALSHIRRATLGTVTLANTQPFVRELAGRTHESVQAQGLSIAPGFQEVTLIASVPLSNEAWRPLAEGEIVAVSAGRLVTRHAD